MNYYTLCILGRKAKKALFETYLGLPTLVGRVKYHTFSYLKDRVWKKLQGWKGKLISDDRCHCCKRVAETTIHAIWECRPEQDVWVGSITSLQNWSTNCLDFMHFFECLLSRLLKLELFLVQAWIIWNQRNAVVHGGQLKESGWPNRQAAKYLDEYKKAQENLTASNAASGRFVWQAPPPNKYKLKLWCCFFLDLQCLGFGAIIRNTNGEVMAGKSAKGPYVHSSEKAEVLTCWEAIEFSMKVGFSRLIIEGDSLNVIRALSNSAANSSLLSHIYDDIRCNLRGMQVMSFRYSTVSDGCFVLGFFMYQWMIKLFVLNQKKKISIYFLIVFTLKSLYRTNKKKENILLSLF